MDNIIYIHIYIYNIIYAHNIYKIYLLYIDYYKTIDFEKIFLNNPITRINFQFAYTIQFLLSEFII